MDMVLSTRTTFHSVNPQLADPKYCTVTRSFGRLVVAGESTELDKTLCVSESPLLSSMRRVGRGTGEWSRH